MVLHAQFVQKAQKSEIKDVDEAVLLLRQALELPNRSLLLNNLANVLTTQIGQTGQIEYVNEVIELYKKVLDLTPAAHPNWSQSLCYLTTMLHTRFGKTGQIEDVNVAIALHREVLRLRQPHPD